MCKILIDVSVAGALHVDELAGQVQTVILGATYVLGLVALTATFLGERGTERSRVAWILGGLAVGFGALQTARFLDQADSIWTGASFPSSVSPWLQVSFEILPVAIPLSVAYAVIRHHALNVGFIANRTLVYGLSLCVGFAVLALLDFLTTKAFANNEFEVGLDIAAALAIGISLQFLHPRAVRLIDRVFLPDRYRAAIELDKLRTALAFVRAGEDAPNRAVEAVAGELMLASLALFRRLPGWWVRAIRFCRLAPGVGLARFRGRSLTAILATTARVKSIDGRDIALLNAPPEPARPKLGMALSSQSASASLMLVGAHANGRLPDRDEVRSISSLLREFATVGTEMSEISPMAGRVVS